MKRASIIKDAERELDASGYATVLASNMHTFADVFAQGRGRKFIIKAVRNIDSVTRKEAEALSALSQFMGAEPLVVGEISRNDKLKDGVSYYRFSIRCISPEMLSHITTDDSALLASKSVGVKVRIDAGKLRRLRKITGTGLTDLAIEAKISRSTLYKHEMEVNYASVTTVAKLEKILNGSIRANEGSLPFRKLKLNPSEISKSGLQLLQIHIAPFDLVAKNKNYFEISLDANSRTMIKRAAFFNAIRETFENNYPFFLSNRKKENIHGVPVVGKKQMAQIESEEDLLDLVY